MPRLNDAKKITLGTTPVKALWLGDKKIWPSISEDLRRYLPAIDQLVYRTDDDFWPTGLVTRAVANGVYPTKYTTYGYATEFPAVLKRTPDYGTPYGGMVFLNSNSNDFNMNAIVNGDCVIEAISGTRTCIRVEVSGLNLRVSTYGDRGAGNLSFSVYWPGGTKLLSISTMKDWYGYRIKVLIDAQQVETATNGGAFKRSENLFSDPDASVQGSGNIVFLTASQRSLLDNSETFAPLPVGESSISWVKYDSDRAIPDPVFDILGVSPATARGWLFSGGAGGRNSRSGDPGNSVVIPTVKPGSKLVAGSGGKADSYNNNPGGASTLDDISSADGVGRIEPAIGSSVPEFPLPGLGGKAGSEDESPTPGKRGGLVIARTWF